MPAGQTAAAALSTVAERLPLLDWHELWSDDAVEEYILEPLLPARRAVTIYSAPKVGKSLLVLEIAVALSRGERVLGALPDQPRRVLYVDFENDPRGDIRARLEAMGYGPDDLDQLCYLSYPTLPALDSKAGGEELLRAIQHYRCSVVIIDTMSRAVAGEENENDTWLGFYRHTGLRLKQNGVALIRLDHSGKDITKGQRGGSAKSGDVDAVWLLTEITTNVLRLHLEASRLPISTQTLTLYRETEPRLRHRSETHAVTATNEARIEVVLEVLDQLQVPRDAGRDQARAALKNANVRVGTATLADAIKRRKTPVHNPPGQTTQLPLSPHSQDSERTTIR